MTESNPRSVLQAIGSNGGFDLNQSNFDVPQTAVPTYQAVSKPAFSKPAELIPVVDKIDAIDVVSTTELSPELNHDSQRDVISIRINPETNPIDREPIGNVLENAVESASQIQQLAARLAANELELQQRETQLDQRIEAWDQATAEHQQEFEKRNHQLEQQASQVRCQQLHVMQLQTDIVKSHDATREAIESLVLQTGSDEATLATMKALKYELSGRFDYIARRWEHLAELMHNLHTQIAANQAVDDSVDWTGELS